MHIILPCSAHIYTNQWGVHVDGGDQEADDIAEEHGFINHGQVSINIFIHCLSYLCFTIFMFCSCFLVDCLLLH